MKDTMIMTRNGINHARDLVAGIKSNVENGSEKVSDVSSAIKSNNSFNIFSQGTDFGAGLSEQWEELFNNYNDLIETIHSLIDCTNTYLDEQEALNNSALDSSNYTTSNLPYYLGENNSTTGNFSNFNYIGGK